MIDINKVTIRGRAAASAQGREQAMSSKQQHWTDRHGFVLSAASAGLLAWALMSIWQSGTSCVRDRDCDEAAKAPALAQYEAAKAQAWAEQWITQCATVK